MGEQINRLLWVAFFNGLATAMNFIVLVALSNRLDTIIGQLGQIARRIG